MAGLFFKSGGCADVQIGAWSMAVRQTNVVWLAWILSHSVLRLLEDEWIRMGVKEDDAGTSDGRGDVLLEQVESFRMLRSSRCGECD
jgi:hypothetical protein